MNPPKLTHPRLLEVLDYNPETGHFVWKIFISLRGPVGKRAGSPTVNGYRVLGIDGEKFAEHRLAWFYVYGTWPEGDVDHKNHKGTDNSISNLRDTSTSLNIAHKSSPRSDNKSGVTGVHFSTEKNRWAVSIGNKHGGYFDLFDDAVRRRKTLETAEYGEFSPKG